MEEKEDTRMVSESSRLREIDLIKKEVHEINKQYYDSLIRIKELIEQNEELKRKVEHLENTLYDLESYRGK